jgi:DNA-binding NarL/FixJ family response regulator
MPITIFLADDHPIVLDGLRLILNQQTDMTIVGEAENGRDAVRRVSHLQPDIVIIDITMPELNGVEATRQIRRQCPATRVIVLSIHATSQHVTQALAAGASGYLLKGGLSSEVITAIRAVHAGQTYLSQKVANLVTANETPGESGGRLDQLSPREREVLQMVVEGRTSAEIAETLFLSPKTIETYRYRIMQKLKVHSVPDLVKLALQIGLTPLE